MEPWLYYLLFGIFFIAMMRFGCGGHVMGGHGRHGHASDRDAGAELNDKDANIAKPRPTIPATTALKQGAMALRPVAPPRMPQRREQ